MLHNHSIRSHYSIRLSGDPWTLNRAPFCLGFQVSLFGLDFPRRVLLVAVLWRCQKGVPRFPVIFPMIAPCMGKAFARFDLPQHI
jgi:hypothetical protein